MISETIQATGRRGLLSITVVVFLNDIFDDSTPF
jgi:hypothetical protein